jgi:hypothetical protein
LEQFGGIQSELHIRRVQANLDAVGTHEQRVVGKGRDSLKTRERAARDESYACGGHPEQSKHCGPGFRESAGFLRVVHLGGEGAVEIERDQKSLRSCEFAQCSYEWLG